ELSGLSELSQGIFDAEIIGTHLSGELLDERLVGGRLCSAVRIPKQVARETGSTLLALSKRTDELLSVAEGNALAVNRQLPSCVDGIAAVIIPYLSHGVEALERK